jgi:hypothetical protein
MQTADRREMDGDPEAEQQLLGILCGWVSFSTSPTAARPGAIVRQSPPPNYTRMSVMEGRAPQRRDRDWEIAHLRSTG